MIDNQIFTYLESRLTFAARRQQALSNNIANMDTPGYKAQDVEFADELAGASSTRVVEIDGNEKANGNTVDLESQMTELTKNGLQYVTLIQYLNQKLKTLRSSISEGT